MTRKSKKKHREQAEGTELLKGRLEVVRSGMGFVIVEGQEKDILVRREHLGTGLDGDEVRVEITRASKNGRQEGMIRSVIQRKQSEFSGRLDVHAHFAFFIADKGNMPVDIFVPLHLLHDAKNGDRAIVRII